MNITQLGKFEILGKIGEGPLTAVYRAKHLETNQTVCLKLLPEKVGQHASVVKKLQSWSIQMKTPPHPGIVLLLGLEENAGRYFTISPEIEGGTLREKVGNLTIEDANHVLLRLTDILKTLHQFEYFHLNIKPENILFNEQGKIFLADCGLASIIRPIIDSFSGTPGYMSPEQIEGTAVSPSSDFYTLGILLFEMLSGKPPYQADSQARLVVQQMTHQLPKLHQLNPEIPEIYDQLIARLTAVDPEHRPANAQEASDLIISVIAEVEEWPDRSDADYAEGLPIFEHLSLYAKREPTREDIDRRREEIETIKNEEEMASQKRMENFHAIEEERQARVREQLNQQRAQERTIIIIGFAVLLVFILGLVGYYLTS
ncbi:MAG: serine/threonine-protein kinase [Chloroflexota bacterium]